MAFRIIDMQILIYAKFAEKSYRRFLFLSHNRPRLSAKNPSSYQGARSGFE